MRLIELIAEASGWANDITTIYVEQPWSCEANAILVSPAPDTTDPVKRDGRHYEYFIETFIARDVIEGLIGSIEERCQRLISYAQNEA
ncbi:MAG: hypothetical protein BGO57_10325 [Sphingomonadales bacterium 63-6]|nr:MAG: hypothetical protein BGO57_10325 [Sphingomonadales bacterium 63-6]